MKYLLWALLIYLAWRWFSASRARKNAQDSDAAPHEAAASGAGGERSLSDGTFRQDGQEGRDAPRVAFRRGGVIARHLSRPTRADTR